MKYFASYNAASLLKASAGMAGTMKAALLVAVGTIYGKQRYIPTKQAQETSMQLCAAVRRLPRKEIFWFPQRTPPGIYLVVRCLLRAAQQATQSRWRATTREAFYDRGYP